MWTQESLPSWRCNRTRWKRSLFNENEEASTKFITGAEERTMNEILNKFEIEKSYNFYLWRFCRNTFHQLKNATLPYDSTRALHSDSFKDPCSPPWPMSPVSNTPSNCLKKGWKNSSWLPLLCSNICIAMGSEGPNDIDSEKIDSR